MAKTPSNMVPIGFSAPSFVLKDSVTKKLLSFFGAVTKKNESSNIFIENTYVMILNLLNIYCYE